MQVPTIIQGQFIDEDKGLSKEATNLMEQLLENMQSDLGSFGFAIPNVSSDPASVTPNAVGGQLSQVQATYGSQNGVKLGTLIFDPFEVNGGSPNGQLKVLLGDGTFHKITNT